MACEKKINGSQSLSVCPQDADNFLLVKADGTDFLKLSWQQLKLCVQALLPNILDIVNIGAGNPDTNLRNTVQVKNTGEVFFVDKDGDVQQLEFIQSITQQSGATDTLGISVTYAGNTYTVGLDIKNLPVNDINPKAQGGVPFYNANTETNEYLNLDRFMANVFIPKPEVRAATDRQSVLLVSYRQGGLEWLKYNPEIFLLRYKRHRKTTDTVIPNVEVTERKRNGWVHPTDSFMNSIGRWDGWKFFNGKHFDYKGNEITVTRRTEFPLFTVDVNGNTIAGVADGQPYNAHNQFAPYKNAIVPFNVFGYSLDAKNNWDVPFDVTKANWRLSLDKFTGALKSQRHEIFATELEGNQIITGEPRRKKKVHTQMYKVVFAIDNPFATKTNGLCPKIFGAESDIIFVRNYLERSENVGRYIRVGATNSIP